MFSSPTTVWHKLDERYHVPKNTVTPDQVRQSTRVIFFAHLLKEQFIKMRVANVVLQWLKQEMHVVDSYLASEFDNFTKVLKKDKFDLGTLITKELAQEVR